MFLTFWKSETNLSQKIGVENLEHFVEPKLAQSLHGVPNECGRPALCESPNPLLLSRHSEAVEHVLVLLRVNLMERPEIPSHKYPPL